MNRENASSEFFPSRARHPGEYVRADILDEHGVSQGLLAKWLGVRRLTVNRIVQGHQGISAEMALRLGKLTKKTPDYWLNLQRMYDLNEAKEKISDELEQIEFIGALTERDEKESEASEKRVE